MRTFLLWSFNLIIHPCLRHASNIQVFILKKTCTCSFMLFLSCIHIGSLVASRIFLILTSAILFPYRTQFLSTSIRQILFPIAFKELAIRSRPMHKGHLQGQARPDQSIAQWYVKHPVTFTNVYVLFTAVSLSARENREILTRPCVC
jgi:hypothetical protein